MLIYCGALAVALIVALVTALLVIVARDLDAAEARYRHQMRTALGHTTHCQAGNP